MAPINIAALPVELQKAANLFVQFKTKEIRGHSGKVHTVAWSCDGRKLASGSVDKTARIWTPEKGTDIRYSIELKGHSEGIDQLVWDPTHVDRLATASTDRTVRIWDQRTGKCTATVRTTGENINICWSPDGNHIAVGNKDDTVSIIDTRTYKVEKEQKHDFEVNEITWNHSGDLFFLTTGQGTIKIFEYPSLRPLHTLQAHTANCYCLEVDPRGRYLATGSADAIVSLWDLDEWVCVRTFGKLDWPVRTISFSHDGEYLASASEDLVIDISHVESGESVHKIQCTAAMNTVAWHPSRYLLAYAGDEADHKKEYLGNLRIFGFH